MRKGPRNLMLFGGLAVAGYMITSTFASSLGSGAVDEVKGEALESLPSSTPFAVETPASPEESPAAPPPEVEGVDSTGMRSYAVALHELPGLPPDAEPGVRLEIWALWKPPLTKERQVQKLVAHAFLDRMVPPLTPEGPPVAVLTVSEKELDELLFGDRFAELSASIVP